MDKVAELSKLYTVHIQETRWIEFSVPADNFEDASIQAHAAYENGTEMPYTDQVDATMRIHEADEDEASRLVMIAPIKEKP